jgi:hypothetical protein
VRNNQAATGGNEGPPRIQRTRERKVPMSRSDAMERLWEWLPKLPGDASDDDIAREALARLLEFREEAKRAHLWLMGKGLFQEYCADKEKPQPKPGR